MVLTDMLLFLTVMSGAGIVAGMTAGLFGVGGGFVVVPALLAVFPFLGDQSEDLMLVAVGTSLATIVVSSARSVHAHSKRGAVDFQLLRDWAIWVVVGVGVGIWIASVSNSQRLILVFAIGVLVYSIYFLFPRIFDRYHGRFSLPTGPGKALLASGLGGVSALLGIGGGTVMVLAMVLCNRPIHQAVATASGVGFLIGVPGMIGFMVMGLDAENLPVGSIGYINIPALLAIAVFSIFTAPIGARLAHSLDGARLKQIFGIYLVIVSVSMFLKA
ncbi:sulfite exporter TauE/SafE family protein [Congregibacter sp.]|uniref:sulfite exporter TauE/SafE family protein n=1 Tax=Congregibacter sp. TaxID=2744308 RepID=UPI0039E5B5E4